MKRILLIILTFIASISLFSEQYIINSARKGSIQQLIVLDDKKMIFTGDENGFIQVISSQYNHIIKSFRIGTSGIYLMAVHPEGTQFAVVSQESDKYYLTVWNWQSGKRLSRLKLSELPLTLGYSAKGQYIYYSKISSPSVKLINSSSGKAYNYLRNNPYNIQDVYIGSSEERVMGYSASGFIYYLDIKTSSLKGEMDTVSELKEVQVLQTGNKRYFTAWKNNTLYLIDRLTGEVMDSHDFNEISFVSLEPLSDTIAVMSGRQNSVLNLFSIENKRFVPYKSNTRIRKTQVEEISIDSPMDNLINMRFNHLLTQMEFKGDKIYFSFNNGDIYNFSIRDKSISKMISNVLSELDNIILDGDNLYLSADQHLVKISTEYFNSGSKGLSSLEDADIIIKDTDFEKALLSYDPENEDSLYYYGQNSFSYYLNHINSETLEITTREKLNAPVSSLETLDNNVFTLENSGTINLGSNTDSFPDFRYSALGIQGAVYLDETRVAAGKNISRTADSPLYLINTQTKETIPLSDDRFLVYDLNYDRDNETLYSIGLKEDSSGEVETTLVSHNLENLKSRGRTIASAPEDLNAFVKIIDGEIATNLGKEGFQIISNGRRYSFSSTNKSISDITFNKNFVFTLNSDYSLSLWNRKTRKEIISFYLFSDGEWAAIPSSVTADVFYCSEGGLKYVSRQVSGKIYKTYTRNAIIK